MAAPKAAAAAAAAAATCSRASRGAALSLGEAAAMGARAVRALELVRSPDLQCRNIMCASAGGPCVCRLSSALDKLTSLEELDLRDNDLQSAALMFEPGRGALDQRGSLRSLHLARGNDALVADAGGAEAYRAAATAAMPNLRELDGEPLSN